MRGRGVEWYGDRIAHITNTIPERAHALAAQQAAGLAAKAVRSKSTGALARDVATARRVTPLRSIVGSDLVYAAIQNTGGVIVPRNAKRLVIRGKRSARSDVGGPIVATAQRVVIKPKLYLGVAVRTYPELFLRAAKRLMA